MNRSIFLCALAISLLAGCGTVFTHPGKDQRDLDREFARDRAYCEEYVKQNPGPDTTCKVERTLASTGTVGGLPGSALPADDATCATCEDVKRCLIEQKGWRRVKN